jgi:hypothetical protein
MESYVRNNFQRVVINDYSSTWKEVQHGVPQGLVLRPLLCLIYINNLSKSISDKSNPILFADDTSFIITNHDDCEFRHKVNEVFNKINKRFHSNLLMLNYDKTYFLQFTTKTNKENNMQILYNNKTITTIKSIKFLGLTLNTTLNWKHHINKLIPRLKQACYVIRSIKPFMSPNVLRSTYYSYAHSIMSYGLIFWGNSTDSNNIFKIHKRLIRIITNSNKNAPYRKLFKSLNILPLQSQYIYSILLFTTKNKDQSSLHSHIHAINTRHKNNLYVPAANLTLYQKVAYYSWIKIFDYLPTTIKNLSSDRNKFQTALKKISLKQFILHPGGIL